MVEISSICQGVYRSRCSKFEIKVYQIIANQNGCILRRETKEFLFTDTRPRGRKNMSAGPFVGENPPADSMAQRTPCLPLVNPNSHHYWPFYHM